MCANACQNEVLNQLGLSVGKRPIVTSHTFVRQPTTRRRFLPNLTILHLGPCTINHWLDLRRGRDLFYRLVVSSSIRTKRQRQNPQNISRFSPFEVFLPDDCRKRNSSARLTGIQRWESNGRQANTWTLTNRQTNRQREKDRKDRTKKQADDRKQTHDRPRHVSRSGTTNG